MAVTVTTSAVVVLGCSAVVWAGVGFGCGVELWMGVWGVGVGVGVVVGGRTVDVVGGGVTIVVGGVVVVVGVVGDTTTGDGVVTKQRKKVWSAIDR